MPAIRAAFATGKVEEFSSGPLGDIEREIVMTPEEREAHSRAEAELEGMNAQEVMERFADRLSKRIGQ